MKRNIIITILLLFSFLSYSQQGHKPRESVKKLYEYLLMKEPVSINKFYEIYFHGDFLSEARFVRNVLNRNKDLKEIDLILEYRSKADTLKSSILREMQKNKKLLVGRYDLNYIYKQIDKSTIIYEGAFDSYLLKVHLDNNLILYFTLSGPFIFNIWLPDGNSFDDLIDRNDNPRTLKRPGIIKDKDGYVNVRQSGSIDSPVYMKVFTNQVFYYTPTCYSNWYAVYETEEEECIGYMHKSRIVEYKDFPKRLKDKVQKDHSGC